MIKNKKKVISLEYIFNVIKNYRRRALYRYNETTSGNGNVDYAYYNGMIKVLDELKNDIKKTVR
jgi:CRISPR/Cas system-associated protein Csm6